MGATSSRLRFAALLGAGALAVHQLRYLIVYGDRSKLALAAQGHGYFSLVVPAVIALVGLAAVGLAVRLTTAPSTHESQPAASTARLWMAASALLVLVHFSQETLEGLFADGHPSGLGGTIAHGGWIAVLLSVAIGGIIALLLRGAAAVEQSGREAPGTHPGPPLLGLPATGLGIRLPIDPVSRHQAGRGPPITCS
jgi:hypothetical protein